MRAAFTGPVDGRAADALDIVRSIVAACGVRESTSPDDAGFYCEPEGAHEIAVRYNAVGAAGPFGRAAQRAAEAALLGCCSALVDSGMTVTVVMSPRTLVLFLANVPAPT